MSPKDILSYYTFLKGEALAQEEQNEKLAKFVDPRRRGDKSTNNRVTGTTPDFSKRADVFDPIGQEASIDMATCLMSWIWQPGWLKAEAPRGIKPSENLKKSLDELSEIANDMIGDSNFSATHFSLARELSFGTICKYREFRKEEQKLHFRCEPTFVCAMGKDEQIDTVFVPKTYTARQAAEEFGIDRIPEKIRKQAEDPKKWHETSEYIHFAMPNPKAVNGSPLQEQMPWLTAWIHKDTGVYVKDRFGKETAGGAMDSPYLVGGFLPASTRNPNAPYYDSLAYSALPDMQQLQHIVKAIDGRIEMEYAPPVGIPDSIKGKVGLRPYDHFRLGKDGAMPQAFEFGGNGIADAMVRADQLRDSINRKFLRQVFKIFEGLDPAQMTATEVQARLGEKADFLPMFGLIVHDFASNDGLWTFNQIIQAGLWTPPQELMLPGNLVRTPRVGFANKLTQLLEKSKAMASMNSVTQAAQVVQLTGDPSPLDRYDVDQICLANYRAESGLADGIKTDAAVKKQRAERVAMQKELMAMQQQGQAA